MNLSIQFFYFYKILKMREKILWNPQTFLFFDLYCTKIEKMLTDKATIKSRNRRWALYIYIHLACLSICLFASIKHQNGWTFLKNIQTCSVKKKKTISNNLPQFFLLYKQILYRQILDKTMPEQWMIHVDRCSLKSRFIGLKSEPLCIALIAQEIALIFRYNYRNGDSRIY